MNRLKQLKIKPFGLLLRLEWILLGMAFLGEVPRELIWGDYGEPSGLIPSFPVFSLLLLIQDNGRGFSPQQITTGFGLQGMRERVKVLGGILS